MKNFAGRLLASAASVALILAGATLPAAAQTYPVNNPTYIPAAVLSAQSCAAACDVVFNVNGSGSVTFRLSGSATGITAVIQGSNDRASSPAYSSLSIYPVGGPKIATILGNGLYRVSTQGLTSVRLHLTAVTGTVVISGAGEPAGLALIEEPPRKATYSAAFVAFAPASSPTDFFSLTGNATTTVEVKEVRCSGRATAAATQTLEGVVRSAAETGTPTALTAVPLDSNSPAALAAAATYAANPTPGALVGVVRADNLTSVAAASTTGANPPLVWTFGGIDDQPLILRGAAQVFALNGAGASFGAGEALNCSIAWTEQ
jgi:hypothetical protein